LTRPPHDISASVKQRLLNLARAQGEDFNTLLVRYAIERFLYRLSKSSLSDQMVLKGAMLFVVWRPTPHRPTRDLDLLGFGDPSPESVAERIKDILATTFEDDGLHFDSESIEAGPIREDQTYGGVRVTFRAMLGKARIDLQVDVGFGDAVVGPNVTASYPSLLGFPAAVIRVYSREAVIAEKLHAMVELGSVNSRMKDFYDILILSREFDFDDRGLVEAIARIHRGRADAGLRRRQADAVVGISEAAETEGRSTRICQSCRVADKVSCQAGRVVYKAFRIAPSMAAGRTLAMNRVLAATHIWRNRIGNFLSRLSTDSVSRGRTRRSRKESGCLWVSATNLTRHLTRFFANRSPHVPLFK